MQQSLLNLIPPRDPYVPEQERPRLAGQNRAILNRLKQGRVTNRELAGIALKYTSRISDLRNVGYDVRCVSRDYQTGVSWYELQKKEE